MHQEVQHVDDGNALISIAFDVLCIIVFSFVFADAVNIVNVVVIVKIFNGASRWWRGRPP